MRFNPNRHTGVPVLLSLLLTLSAARPVQGAPPATRDLNSEAHAQFSSGQAAAESSDPAAKVVAIDAFSEAARAWLAAAAEIIEEPTRRASRGLLMSKALNSFELAFVADPGRCHLLVEATFHADRYLETLRQQYPNAEDIPEYEAVNAHRSRLNAIPSECAASSPRIEAPQCPPVSAATSCQPAPNSAPAPDHGKRLRIVTGITSSLALALLATSLGAGLSRYRQPFVGAAYQDIYDAAVASLTDDDPDNDVSFSPRTDMCDSESRARNGTVDAACARWDHLGVAAVVTGAAAGVAGIVAIASTAVLIERRRKSRRAHALSFAPRLEGGATVQLSLPF